MAAYFAAKADTKRIAINCPLIWPLMSPAAGSGYFDRYGYSKQQRLASAAA